MVPVSKRGGCLKKLEDYTDLREDVDYMKMYVCDKCKKPVFKHDKTMMVLKLCERNGIEIMRFDLCEHCRIDFLKWIKQKTGNDECIGQWEAADVWNRRAGEQDE